MQCFRTSISIHFLPYINSYLSIIVFAIFLKIYRGWDKKNVQMPAVTCVLIIRYLSCVDGI